MADKRIAYVDNAKGILITMMVFAHVFLDDVLVPITEWIYTFHMPAFFIINGMLFHYTKTREMPTHKMLMKYVYSILVPLLFSECIGVLTYIVRYGYTQNIFGFAYNLLHYHFNNGPDWFFVVLFVADVFFVLIHKTAWSPKVKIGVSFLVMAIGYSLPDTQDILKIARSMAISYGFLCIGYWGVKLFTTKHHWCATIAAFAITVVVSMFNGSVSLNIARVNNPLLYTLGAVSGTYFIICLARMLDCPPLAYIGGNSVVVMITHQAIMLPIRHYTGIAEFNFWQGTLVFLFTMLLQYPLSYVFNRFLPFCIGRKVQLSNFVKHGDRT